MGWDEQSSRDRVEQHSFEDEEIEVADLARTMDFANLSTKQVRRAEAAHLYADVPNFHAAVLDAGADKQKQKKLIRAASVLRKVQSDLLKAPEIIGDDQIGRIQLQAARLHALCYKPYSDEAQRALRAVVMGITLNTYMYDVFNGVFDDVRNFQSAVGVAAGTSLIANIGTHGDRERICLGSSANLAAKVLGAGNTVTVTEEVYDHLPESLQARFDKAGVVAGHQTFKSRGLRWSTAPEVAEELDIDWDEQWWREQTEAYRDELPLADMEVSEAEVAIDVGSLTERNSRRTEAIAVYADLDGFTRHVQNAEEDDEVAALVQQLHMIRHEFHAILKDDYSGVVLQHQGDRVFAILHEPCGDDDTSHGRRCRKAIDAAIGVQSSMEQVLRGRLGDRKDLRVAVGLAVGRVLVSRLGKKGQREVICLGPEVIMAEDLQLESTGGQVRLTEELYETINDEVLKGEFKEDDGSFVADGLTFRRLDDLREEAAARSGKLGAVAEAGRVRVVTDNPRPQKPWMPEP
ncbi:MAG: hypothetical protein KF745_02695 [Phycisphaeraceae bacterium]|nr:hypothetical protein [Phycisphaeraceae bacterium]